MKSATLALLLSLSSFSWGALMNNCHEDNLLRYLLNPTFTKTASQFCSTYIESTKTTSTTTSALATKTGLFTLPNSFITTTIRSTLTSTSTEIDVSTLPDPTVDVTVTVASGISTHIILQKRAGAASVPAPLITYPATRLSSACSCLISAAATTTLVSTSRISTTKSTTSTLPATATKFITVTILTTTIAREIDTSFAAAASTITATATSIVPATTDTIYCGVEGPSNVDLDDANIIEPFLPAMSASECLASCLPHSDCLSVLSTPYYCFLLKQTVGQLYTFHVADAQFWYDRDCPIS